MSKLTENDLMVAYVPYLTKLVREYAPRVSFKDAFAEAQEELLFCIRCYRRAFHGRFWIDYARPNVCERLKVLQKAQNARQHWERVSLDACIKEDSEETFGKLLLVEPAKVTGIELFELISRASKQAQRVGHMIVDKYTQPEIEAMLHISHEDYQHALAQLGTTWEEYNRETI